jgi:hypothetical protein
VTIDLDSLITAARARADDTAATAQQIAASALNNFFTPGGTQFNATAPTLRSTPPAYTGNTSIVPEIQTAFAEAFAELKPELEDALADFLGRFYPTCVGTNTDNWICNTILYGGTGLPAAVQDAIWERARRAELAEANRLTEEAIDAFAARGFTLPGGAVYAAVLKAQQDAANKSSTLARDTAIDNAKLALETIKFAVQQGVQLRIGVIGAIGAYLKAFMQPAELAVERARVMAQAQQQLWSSSADYYRAMVAEAQLSLSAQEITARSHDTLMNSQNAALERFVEHRTQAAISVAQVLGNLAAGASSATVTLAGQETMAVTGS